MSTTTNQDVEQANAICSLIRATAYLDEQYSDQFEAVCLLSKHLDYHFDVTY